MFLSSGGSKLAHFNVWEEVITNILKKLCKLPYTHLQINKENEKMNENVFFKVYLQKLEVCEMVDF